jgi:hypothetical protein
MIGHRPRIREAGALREAISPMARIRRRNLEETIMLRKLSLVAAAAASLGAAALVPTSASAGGWHHHGWHHGGWHHHHHHRWGGPRVFIGGPFFYGGCYVRRLVPTPWGPRWRLVNRCY